MRAIKFLRLVSRTYGIALASIPMGFIRPLARIGQLTSIVLNPSQYWEGRARREIGCQVLGLSHRQTSEAVYARYLENLLDQRMASVARTKRNWAGLDECAQELAKSIRETWEKYPGSPVILSPFHFVSQYVNIQVCDHVRQILELETMGVVSAMPYGVYGDDNALVPNLKVFHTYADGARSSLGVSFFRALKRDRVAVLFADVAPFSLARAPMETTAVRLFGKPARIHNGVFRLGRQVDARLLSFFLRFEGAKFSYQVFDTVPLRSDIAPQAVADLVQSAIEDNYGQWLQAGHPSMYWFSPAK